MEVRSSDILAQGHSVVSSKVDQPQEGVSQPDTPTVSIKQ